MDNKPISEMTNAELDEAVAVEVMGWKKVKSNLLPPHLPFIYEDDEDMPIPFNYYNFSSSISHAWMVIDKSEGNFTLRRFWKLSVADPENYPMEWDCDIRFGNNLGRSIRCATPERAICEAALYAMRSI